MPSLSVDKALFTREMGRNFTEHELGDIAFDFGVELDEIYEENGRMMLKFDIPANRYDLLCLEGFASALKTYLDFEVFKDIEVCTSKLKVTRYQTHERPYIACAVVRDITFTDDSFESFISYQTKLHSSIGRNRALVAIGTHDLGKISGEVVYRSVDLSSIGFVPLGDTKEVRGDKLEAYFSADKQISKYFDLLSDRSKAVIFSCGTDIISIPPIINSEVSKVSPQTRDLFIEVTGTNFHSVNSVLKHLLYNFRGQRVEKVRIQNAEDETEMYTPVFNNYKYILDRKKVNQKLHLNLSPEDIARYLRRMMYIISVEDEELVVNIPDARSDVLHECDILEDIAIAHGFNNFKAELPKISSIGGETPGNRFTDKVRLEMALSGYIEVLTHTLLSKSENIVDSDRAAVLANPKSREYEVVRTSLLPGILKSIAANLHYKIPIKVFEAADVVILDEKTDEGARNERKLCAVIAANKSLLEDVQGPLSLLLEKSGMKDFKYRPFKDERYLENQAAVVEVAGEVIGSIGVLHPKVCQQFEIPYAASSFEISLEKLFAIFKRLK